MGFSQTLIVFIVKGYCVKGSYDQLISFQLHDVMFGVSIYSSELNAPFDNFNFFGF